MRGFGFGRFIGQMIMLAAANGTGERSRSFAIQIVAVDLQCSPRGRGGNLDGRSPILQAVPFVTGRILQWELSGTGRQLFIGH